MVGQQKGQNGLKRMGVGLDRDTKGQDNLHQSRVTTEQIFIWFFANAVFTSSIKSQRRVSLCLHFRYSDWSISFVLNSQNILLDQVIFCLPILFHNCLHSVLCVSFLWVQQREQQAIKQVTKLIAVKKKTTYVQDIYFFSFKIDLQS